MTIIQVLYMYICIYDIYIYICIHIYIYIYERSEQLNIHQTRFEVKGRDVCTQLAVFCQGAVANSTDSPPDAVSVQLHSSGNPYMEDGCRGIRHVRLALPTLAVPTLAGSAAAWGEQVCSVFICFSFLTARHRRKVNWTSAVRFV